MSTNDHKIDFTKVKKLQTILETKGSNSFKKRSVLLKKIREYILKHYHALISALRSDLNKSEYESLIGEISLLLEEIKFFKGRLKRVSNKRNHHFNLTNLLLKSEVHLEPLGVCLIISSFNFPFQLTMMPLIGALAAGNKVILKLSEHSNETHKFVLKMCQNILLDDVYVMDNHVLPDEIKKLYQNSLQMVFFTGSNRVGKLVYAEAAKHNLKVVLEMGGANPLIIMNDANFAEAAAKIVWSKLFNKGQVCVNPNYVLVSQKKFKILKELLQKEITKQLSHKTKNILVNK